MPRIDPKAFRRALGNFATGVTVITAQDDKGNRVGVTANSFNSVSLDPALILWSIDKRSRSQDVFLEASHFTVNILSVDQINVSNNFARPVEDKFAEMRFTEGAGGSAIIEQCAAHFECELYQTIDAGDHIILIGKVIAFSDNGKAPLLYHQGTYSAVLPHPSLKVSENVAEYRAQKSRADLYDNMHYLLTQAVRAYQNEYYPKQLAVGLSVSEARLVMVLYGEHGSTKEEMLKEVGMPMREINVAVDALKAKGLLECHDKRLNLTKKGHETAAGLCDIAVSHQSAVFDHYSENEINTFKKILRELIARDTP